ncbi:MAG: 50S ribosomal protein L6 [Planctomycetaceae bacterium]|nr:50S ribosomal protein L6 [Planctomycetota bacterium]MCQ3950917.1 50S ribosomal protein L6 [Planctomycetota bacterium]NUO15072.1 50S ribosomal protein L6 [Planctomycetaceae bacterium]GIK53624.1 MAG: 50S ribosomal protein L6 [Planctomycetota bacterium]
MSRIGKQPVIVPSGVKVAVSGMKVQVEGPKGKLEFGFRPEVTVDVAGQEVKVGRRNESKLARALHGTTRALLQNMIQGVVKGYLQNMDIVGVGWAAKIEGKKLILMVGFCHSIDVDIPAGVNVKLPNPQRLEISGIDKQAVRHFAAKLRGLRTPEPYKGKGIRYEGEHIALKAGKSFVGGAGGKK